jgi:hypothetical protein
MTSSDGKMTGNVQTVGRYEESKKPKRPNPSGGESGGVHDPEGHDEIKQVVGEHGAADRHVITKNAGKDGVHSETHHKSGHIHHADHASLDEAHQHGKVAMEDAEHNPMSEDAMGDAGDRENSEHPMGKSVPSFME